MSQSLPPETPETPETPQTPETPENPDLSEAPPTPSRPEADAAVALVEAPVAAEASAPAADEALLRRALEGLLFITDRPLSAGELGRLVGVKDQERIAGVVEELRRELEEKNGGYRLMAVAEGWQMATRSDLAPYVRKLFADRATMRLSTAAQETLSIVAYRQPLTRAEIEEIRGVEVIAALETLLEKRLLKVVGRKETVGRPLLYGTTPEFLRHYGLRSLEDMPPIDSFAPDAGVAPQEAPAEASYARAQSEPEPESQPQPEVQAEAGPALEPEPAAQPEGGDTTDDGGLWPK